MHKYSTICWYPILNLASTKITTLLEAEGKWQIATQEGKGVCPGSCKSIIRGRVFESFSPKTSSLSLLALLFWHISKLIFPSYPSPFYNPCTLLSYWLLYLLSNNSLDCSTYTPSPLPLLVSLPLLLSYPTNPQKVLSQRVPVTCDWQTIVKPFFSLS